MNKIKCILVDDEKHCNETLDYYLKRHFAEIEVLETFTDARAAIQYLQNHEIDLLFLDIQMPHLSGFDILNQLKPFDFEVIFVTAFDQFAIKAIKYSALDYLQKPIDLPELRSAIKNLQSRREHLVHNSLFDHLLHIVQGNNGDFFKISLPTEKGYIFLDLEQILWFKSNESRDISKLKLTDGREVEIHLSISELDQTIANRNFVRVHNEYLIQKEHVLQLINGKDPFLIMKDETKIPISKFRKEIVMQEILIL